MFVNKLKLNQDKTEFISFASPAHHRKLQHVSLQLDEHTTISPRPSDSIRLLGCVLDKQMSMNVSKSVNFHSRNISRIRKFIDKDTCHSVVRSLITSRLDYCNSLYDGVTGKNLDRLQKLQRKFANQTITLGPPHVPLPTPLEHISLLVIKLLQRSPPKLWNNLPVNLKECTSISTFKKMLKTHLFKP